MSTETSPSNRSRSKKISGGRVACIVYLPKEEVTEIDKEVDETDTSVPASSHESITKVKSKHQPTRTQTHESNEPKTG